MESRRIMAAVFLAGAAGTTAAGAPAIHDLMPAPSRIEWRPGTMLIDKSFHFVATGPKDPRIIGALARLGVWIEKEARLPKVPSIGGGGPGALRVEWTSAGLPVQSAYELESYTLQVGAEEALLQAQNPLGILRGLETFRQLVRTEGDVTTARAAAIDDFPRFPWRGLLIDPSRRWQPVANIKRTLDGMAAVKMNVLHWHLSDDQGFRLESAKYPGLRGKGSDGLFYTEAQVKDVIEYARARGIRVVPEFDMPGHTSSWLVGHPELGSAPGPYEIVRTWGIFDHCFDPTSEAVYTFVDGFLGTIAQLFPDDYVHIGGDEVTPRRWNENARIQEFAYKYGLRDAHDLQAHFNKRVSDILTRHKKKMVGWDEILHPDLPKSIVVQSWRGTAALDRAARGGYDGILSNGYYLDLMWPAARHYARDPVPAASTLGVEQRRHVLGGEACMWGEYVSEEMLDARVWPRAAAIAERLWSPADLRDVDDMYRRLERQSERLDGLGLTHRSSYLPMLRRIVGERPVEPLKVLADVAEPIKGYGRSGARSYTQATPLTRFVDAVRPESEVARRFRKDVDAWIAAGGEPAALRKTLALWTDNHAALGPAVGAAPDGAALQSLSKDLSALGAMGTEALSQIAEGRLRSAAWPATSRALLDGAARPRAEVEIAVVPALRKLALAASSPDRLRGVPRADWNAWLDKELASQSAPTEED
jgi:hexosaminidase